MTDQRHLHLIADLRDTGEPAGATLVGIFGATAEDTCRVCGCTDFDRCSDDERGLCRWVAPSLCSAHRARDLVCALWQLFTRRLRGRR